jgi:hypothetical protein
MIQVVRIKKGSARTMRLVREQVLAEGWHILSIKASELYPVWLCRVVRKSQWDRLTKEQQTALKEYKPWPEKNTLSTYVATRTWDARLKSWLQNFVNSVKNATASKVEWKNWKLG